MMANVKAPETGGEPSFVESILKGAEGEMTVPDEWVQEYAGKRKRRKSLSYWEGLNT